MPVSISEVQTNTQSLGAIAPSLEIMVDGKPLNQTYNVQSVNVSLIADALVSASFTILDDDPAKGEFVVANDPELLPGKTVEIYLGYASDVVKVFAGIIVGQSLSVNRAVGGSSSYSCESQAIIPADKTKAEPVLTLTYGDNIFDLSAGLKPAANNKLNVKGNISFQGNSALVPGNNIQIQGVSDNVNGVHGLVSVNHALSEGNWITSITFGED